MQRKLDMNSLRIKIFSDSYFANAEQKTQLGYIVLLCDGTRRANVLHYASYKSKRILKLAMGGGVFAFADVLEYGFPLMIWQECYPGESLC